MASRRALLKSLGLAGVGGLAGAALPPAPVASAGPRLEGMRTCTAGCVLTPSATEGPYYFNANQLRSDITEGFPGVPVELIVGVLDLTTCQPITGALVDIWHCNAAGLYSGYNQPGGNTVGQDFLRGIQPTDSNGEATFQTVFPGWYSGRAVHIHFKVRLSSSTYVTSQLYFPDAVVQAVTTGVAPYSQRGLPNVFPNTADGIYSGTPNRERLLLSATGDTSGYTASVVLGISGFPVSTEGTPAEAAPTLGTPFPNPTPSVTTLWLTLPRPASRARVALFDVTGREVRALHAGPLLAGRHPVEIDASDLAAGRYVVRADVGHDVLVQELTVAR